MGMLAKISTFNTGRSVKGTVPKWGVWYHNTGWGWNFLPCSLVSDHREGSKMYFQGQRLLLEIQVKYHNELIIQSVTVSLY